jgi:TMEM175 potassium channel family protein
VATIYPVPEPPRTEENDRYYNELAGSSIHRLAGLSDGIFAVAMTLLVLALAVPTASEVKSDAQLGQALINLIPSVITYVSSFLTLGIFWVGQQTQLSQLERTNRDYTWINLAFLLFVTLLPFSTALLAHFYLSRIALVEYWLNILILGALILGSAEYAARAGMFNPANQRTIMRAVRRRVYIAQSLYFIATLLCIVDTRLSIGLIVLIQLNYAIAPRIAFLHRL